MSKNIRTQMGKIIGKTLNSYNTRTKPIIEELKFKEQYQGRIIDCMVGEVDDNYIETPETDAYIVKLENSKEGLVKVPSLKGKTILVDADGNPTETPTEGCRLVSVGENEDNKLIILSKNKNLIDKMTEGDITQSDGSLIPNKTGVISNFIKVKPNTNYVLSEQLTASSNWYAIFEYDKNKKLLKYHYNKNMLTSNETYYVTFKYHNSANINGKFQFEEGSIATPIIEPKSHKTEISINEPLRSLPNGVCDEIVGNQLIRRVGYYIFNGEEGLTPNLNPPYYDDNYTCVFVPMGKNHMVLKNRIAKQNGGFKDNMLGQAKWVYSDDIEGFKLAGNFDMHIKKNKLPTLNKNGFKEFLQNLYKNNKPLEMVYELAEPIIEELPNGITLQGFDDTTMYLENSITPTITYGYNALIPYKEELKNQKEEVEINTLDIENNIIPYLMDMEYNLMTMEDNI